MLRVLIAMTIAAASDAYGQMIVRHGMLKVGSLENYQPVRWAGIVVVIISVLLIARAGGNS